MQFLSGDNLHEMSKPIFSEKLNKYFKMSSAELAQSAQNETFQIKKSDIFYISAQNIDCGYS